MKPWVQFGISPFGVWRNASIDSLGSNTQAGQTTYDDLYADPLKWMKNKWIDNIIPQLYWSMDYPPASHRVLAKWWSGQGYDGHLYLGNGVYKVKNNSDKAWRSYNEILDQVDLARHESKSGWKMSFSVRSHFRGKHERLARRLARKKYRYPALPKPSPFVEKSNVGKPRLIAVNPGKERVVVELKLPDGPLRFLLAYAVKRNKTLNIEDASSIQLKKHLADGTTFHVPLDKKKIKRWHEVAFTVIDKYGQESEPLVLKVDKGDIGIE